MAMTPGIRFKRGTGKDIYTKREEGERRNQRK
jgi:hypothetical protein